MSGITSVLGIYECHLDQKVVWQNKPAHLVFLVVSPQNTVDPICLSDE